MRTRLEILQQIKTINKSGGVYKWYITPQGAESLNIPVNGTTMKNGLHLVYVGLSKNLRQRLNWHCGDQHRPSSIKSGTLSVLRQKINALLTDRWDNKELVDDFMNQHMLVEFEYSEDYETLELTEINNNKLPLNARNNPNFTEFRRFLSRKNGQAKRNSL